MTEHGSPRLPAGDVSADTRGLSDRLWSLIHGCYVHHIIRYLIGRPIEHRFSIREEAPEIDRKLQFTIWEESITDVLK